MKRTIRSIIKRDKEDFRVPRKVQDIIPIKRIYGDGIFMIGENYYSKSFKFTDINYNLSSNVEKENMHTIYSDFLNTLDSTATTKITINNRKVNKNEFKKRLFFEMKDDELDEYRKEYNEILSDKIVSNQTVIQEKYITISVHKNSIEEARIYFNRALINLKEKFGRLGSHCTALTTSERLNILYDFFRTDDEKPFNFNLKECIKRGYDFKDEICPDCYENERDYFKIGDRYGRVLFSKDYGTFVKDDMLSNITALNKNMMLSVDIMPIPMDAALRGVENKLLGVNTNITNWQRKQNQNNNFSAEVPYDMESQRSELKEFLDDLTSRDKSMMQTVLTLVHTADTKKKLDSDTDMIVNAAIPHATLSCLKFQQLDGMTTAIPIGVRKIDIFRTMTSEALATVMPFWVQEVQHKSGTFYGLNAVSNNPIMVDRKELQNGNSFIVGVSGSGKSMIGKIEALNVILKTDADIIAIDPEREYTELVKALGGEVIEISATSTSHINAMDLNKYYGDVDPVIDKSQFIQSLCEMIIAGHRFSKGQQSIIDRCTELVYRDYKMRGYTGDVPTLKDFRDVLLEQPEAEAHSLALELELFTTGSLNTFAKETNVNTENRFISYDIFELGEQLRGIGMLVILDNILNRITTNREKGRTTYILIDEIYLMFMHEYSSQFLFKLWKRVRKYGAYCIGITQNIEDLLQSHTARTMLSNSEFIIMLNQAASDQAELARLLNISREQMHFINNAKAGHGLLKIGSSMVPFENEMPGDTKIYKLISTKPGENM